MLYKKEKICGILQEVIIYKEKKYLIVGIGLNTNIASKKQKLFINVIKKYNNKKIDNKKILKNY